MTTPPLLLHPRRQVHPSLSLSVEQIIDAHPPASLNEKKAMKKAKKAAIKMQEGAKRGSFDLYTFVCSTSKPAFSHVPLTVSATLNEDKALEPPPAKDEDPDGSKLLAAPDALELAAKFLSPIAAIVKDNFDVWIATYDVAMRRSES
jgi:N-alpha-acetyltransferase 15/16, NatA auxiliary subunit